MFLFGSLVELVTISACHAEGHGFESRTSRHCPLGEIGRRAALRMLSSGESSSLSEGTKGLHSSVGQSASLVMRMSAVRIRQEAHSVLGSSRILPRYEIDLRGSEAAVTTSSQI